MAGLAAVGRTAVPPRRRPSATAGVIRLADAVGASTEGWEAAVADAVRGARKDVRAPIGVEITRQWADLEAGRIVRYRVAVRIAYRQELKAPTRRAS